MSVELSKENILELKKLSKTIKFLYVEDSRMLREKAKKFFEQFFDTVHTANDGKEGLELFRKIHPSIVVTDIEMPFMNGIELARKIHKIAPSTKIIITSAHDNAENLYDAINVGIYRFLKKPLVIDKLTQALSDAIYEVKIMQDQQIFDFYVETIFNFQHNLLVLYKGTKPIIANDTFLNFFQVDDLEDFKKKFHSLGDNFLSHKNFLYNTGTRDWFKESLQNLNKLYHVKMMSQARKYHHFIYRMTKIENRDDYYLASFDDITDLNLLKLFDEKQSTLDQDTENQKTFINLLQSIQRNHDEVKLFNLYKGLTVANKGVITSADENKISIQAPYIQQRCAQYEGQIILSHSLFPADILCQNVQHVNFDDQSISVGDLKFLTTSPTQRESIRLVPEDEHKVSLFYEEHKFGDHVKILDISAKAVRLSLISLPAGFGLGEKVFLDMVFTVGSRQPLIINCEGSVMRITEQKHEFQVVITLEPNQAAQKSLIEYLSKRQMALIREFKGLQYGK